MLVSARARVRSIQATESLLYTDPVPWGGIAPAETIATAAAIEGVMILGRLLGKDPEILSKQNSILRYSTLAASGSVTFTLGEVAKCLKNGEVVLDGVTSESPETRITNPPTVNRANSEEQPRTTSNKALPNKMNTSGPRSALKAESGVAAKQVQETPPQLEQPPSIDSPNFKALEGDTLKSNIHEKSARLAPRGSTVVTKSKLGKTPVAMKTSANKPATKDDEDTSTESENESEQKFSAVLVAI